MKVKNLFFILFAIVIFSSAGDAQVPVAQPAPLKVGVVNTEMFSNQTGGITKLVAAMRTLEAEFKPRRDEIATLMGRLDALQKQPTANVPPAQLATRRDQAESLQLDIRRKQEDARVAWGKRVATLTEPIRLSIFNALEAFSKARGVDLLIDQAKFPDGVLLVNKNADMTAAFIRDYNSKNP